MKGRPLREPDEQHYSYAGAYRRIAVKLLSSYSDDIAYWVDYVVAAQIASQSMELYLKAFIQMRTPEKSKWGHNLSKLRKICELHGLVLTPSTVKVVGTLNEKYKENQFRYEKNVGMRIIPPTEILSALNEIGDKIEYEATQSAG